jgi:hypothetical protein
MKVRIRVKPIYLRNLVFMSFPNIKTITLRKPAINEKKSRMRCV